MKKGTDFRTLLKQARESKKISQTTFAKDLNISIKHLNRIENCHQYPPFPLLKEMYNKLGYEFKLKKRK